MGFSLVDEGLVVHIRASKTDPTLQGEIVGVPSGSHPATCPVRAHQAWLAARGEHAGPWLCRINRGDHIARPERAIGGAAVNEIVRRVTRAAGLPAGYSSHSLRAGFVTSAAEAGVEQWAIMAQSRHRSMLVMRGYIRRGSLFRENAAARLGL